MTRIWPLRSLGIRNASSQARKPSPSSAVGQGVIATGPLKQMGSFTKPMTAEDRQALESILNDMFAGFKEVVAADPAPPYVALQDTDFYHYRIQVENPAQNTWIDPCDGGYAIALPGRFSYWDGANGTPPVGTLREVFNALASEGLIRAEGARAGFAGGPGQGIESGLHHGRRVVRARIALGPSDFGRRDISHLLQASGQGRATQTDIGQLASQLHQFFGLDASAFRQIRGVRALRQQFDVSLLDFTEFVTTTFFFLMPMMLLSGFVFPIENMPAAIQPVTYLIPLRYFLVILRSIFLKGVGLETLWPQALALAGWSAGILALAIARSTKRSA